MRDRVFPVRRLGPYELTPWFEPRSLGVLVRWGRRGRDWLVVAQLGPLGVTVDTDFAELPGCAATDIEASGRCCCSGCVGMGPCDRDDRGQP